MTRVRTLRSLVALLLRRMNDAAGIFQVFGFLTDVFVFEPLEPAAVKGFVSSSPHNAMHFPWHFYDAEAAASRESDPTGLSSDVAALQSLPPVGMPARPAAALASEAAVNAALAGGLREEVPVGLVPSAARAWAAQGQKSSQPAEWLQLSLEFGPSAPPGQKDPFALDRADTSLRHPEESHFLHPVLRYFHAASPGCGSNVSSSVAAPCAPVATLHIIEDFHAQFNMHTAHVLPLARFLQHVGARRAAAALSSGGAGSPAPWTQPVLPPAFLAGVMMQLISGCDATTLFWEGAGFESVGETDGWWMKLSVAAEESLAGLRALAVHAIDSAPGVAVTPAEEAWTASVRVKWAAFRAREAAGAAGEGAPLPEELPRPPAPALSAAQAAAAAAARADSEASFGVLTGRLKGRGVLVVDARAGRCRVLAENLGLAPGSARVFSGGAGTKGSAVEIEARPLTAAAAAPHMAAVYKKVLGA
jgi:hypothetical protein